jgi:hypothetical protein
MMKLFILLGMSICHAHNITKGDFFCINSRESCDNHGTCDDDNTACICYISYATYQAGDFTQCNYKRMDKTIALVLTVLPVPGCWGAGYMYVGRWLNAALSLFLFTIIATISCCVIDKKNHAKTAFTIALFFNFVWWIWSVIAFSIDFYQDSNGITLKPM